MKNSAMPDASKAFFNPRIARLTAVIASTIKSITSSIVGRRLYVLLIKLVTAEKSFTTSACKKKRAASMVIILIPYLKTLTNLICLTFITSFLFDTASIMLLHILVISNPEAIIAKVTKIWNVVSLKGIVSLFFAFFYV